MAALSVEQLVNGHGQLPSIDILPFRPNSNCFGMRVAKSDFVDSFMIQAAGESTDTNTVDDDLTADLFDIRGVSNTNTNTNTKSKSNTKTNTNTNTNKKHYFKSKHKFKRKKSHTNTLTDISQLPSLTSDE